jgi:hypothetical protein
MKNIKRLALLSILSFTAYSLSFGNSTGKIPLPYNTAVGIRLGGTEGLTIKQNLGGSHAIEGIIGFRPYGMGITVLYEWTQSTSHPAFQWYYGVGGHIGWGTDRNYYYNKDRKRYPYRRYANMGVDGILGIEFKIPDAPIALSFDIKPSIDFYRSYSSRMYLDPGLGIKVVF